MRSGEIGPKGGLTQQFHRWLSRKGDVMGNLLLKQGLAVLGRAVLLFGAALVAWCVLRSRATALSFEELLFYFGAGPIVFFSLGRFGEFFNRGNTTYQLSRSVVRRSAHQRTVDDEGDLKARQTPDWAWIGAGLIVWGLSYLVSRLG